MNRFIQSWTCALLFAVNLWFPGQVLHNARVTETGDPSRTKGRRERATARLREVGGQRSGKAAFQVIEAVKLNGPVVLQAADNDAGRNLQVRGKAGDRCGGEIVVSDEG